MRVKASLTIPSNKSYLLDKLLVKNTIAFTKTEGNYLTIQYIPEEEILAFVLLFIVKEELDIDLTPLPDNVRGLTEKQLFNQLACCNVIDAERLQLINEQTTNNIY